MRPLHTLALPAIGMALVMALGTSGSTTEPAAAIRLPESFAAIADTTERSVALFGEAMTVIAHPRCMNCHPVNRIPTQGDSLRPHVPPIDAGANGMGPAGLTCHACHQSQTVSTYAGSIASIPGHAHWHLAPASMGWQGRSAAAICGQLKDPARNGNRSLSMLHDHMANDALVGWAWTPGAGRTSPPGTQATFAAIIAAWIATGAACPSE